MSRMDTTLRTKPLPTLPRRRQMIRERLAQEQAELEQFNRLAADANLSPRAAAEARRKVRTAKWAVNQLTKALDYLGEPDPLLDLYRLFGMDLPPELPVQLALPLPKPASRKGPP